MSAVVTQTPLLNERQAAELLGVKPQTLALWRCTNRGTLPYIRLGRVVRYRASAIEKYLEQNTVTPKN